MSKVRILLLCLVLVGGMGAVSYAAVPLYELFCQITGYGGTPKRADKEKTWKAIDKTITVNFDANISKDLPWDFGPEKKNITVKVGETMMAYYQAQNMSDKSIVGTAVFNITPLSVAKYIHKIECFCFSNQELAAGEKARLPVNFSFDPAMMEDPTVADVNVITFSYTFYPSPDKQEGEEEGLF